MVPVRCSHHYCKMGFCRLYQVDVGLHVGTAWNNTAVISLREEWEDGGGVGDGGCWASISVCVYILDWLYSPPAFLILSLTEI